MKNGSVGILAEDNYWNAATANNPPFVIGVIRNPCEWIVSRWAFGVDENIKHPGALADGWIKDHPSIHTDSAKKDSPEDIHRFRNWVEDAHGNSILGMQSLIFAANWLSDDKLDVVLGDSRFPWYV